MKIVRIFAPNIYAVKFNDVKQDTHETDEFNKFMEFTGNAVTLEEYFESNQSLLTFYNITKEEAAVRTVEYASELYLKLKKHATKPDSLFKPFKASEKDGLFPKKKYKDFWIRLYAIKIKEGVYVITGGAIKQSKFMDGDPMTKTEKLKIQRCIDWLKNEGVTDYEAFQELII